MNIIHKVLVVATSRKTRGGITSVVKAHEQGLQWKEYHCHWVQTHRDGSRLRKIAYLANAIIDFLLRLPFYDLVHIHFSTSSSLKRKLFFAKVAHLMGKKILIHFHAFDPDMTIHGTLKEHYRKLFEMADGVIVLSNWWRDEVIKAFPDIKNRIIVLYNPCGNISFDSSIKQKNKILYAGTVCSRKGYADLIKAFAKIAKKYPNWTLSIVGNGEIEKGKQMALEFGISSQVEFLGWVDGKAKEQAFQEVSIFCLPSYAEGFPMAVLDAWAYKLPVITTPVGGIPDVAKDGENMLLFNPGDTVTLAKQLERMMSDLDLRESISKESQRLAQGPFSTKEINQQLEKIYGNLYL